MNELILRKVPVRDVVFGEKTGIDEGVLRINAEELKKVLLEDGYLKSVEVQIARPGEKKRIIPVKDVVEPRAKPGAGPNAFPGLIGSAEPVGTGITYVLDGVTVVTCGRLVNFQEGLIDMAGPGKRVQPLLQEAECGSGHRRG